MKHQFLYTNNIGRFFLYGLCFFLVFLLSFTYSSIATAQDYNWGNLQNLFNYNWDFDEYNMYSLNNNLGMPSAPVFTSNQGRSGFQAQAPQGIQVLSARSKHTLYSFWSRPAQNQFVQSYSPVSMNSYQPWTNTEQPSYPYPPTPIKPFYNEPYWSPTISSSPIGPSMFHAEPYWTGQSAIWGMGSFYAGSTGSTESSSPIGPSMFYGEPYYHPGYGGMGGLW